MKKLTVDNSHKIAHFIREHTHTPVNEWVKVQCSSCRTVIAQATHGSKLRIRCRRCKEYTTIQI